MKSALKVILVVACFALSTARRVSQGELDQVLRNAGATRLKTWQCIVHEESRYETSAHNKVTGDHGIFQISELYWCSKTSRPGGGCGMTCASLRDDDITNDAQCAVLIYNDARSRGNDGFQPWTTYSRCRGL